MYREIEIKNFRCFKKTKISSLARVNLIAGKNGAGKSSLLEAIFIHAGAYNPQLALRVNAFRGLNQFRLEAGYWGETPFDTIFRALDVKERIEIVGSLVPHGKRSLFLKVLREKEELSRVRVPLTPAGLASAGTSSTAQTTHVLELGYLENKKREGTHYLIVSEAGQSVEPPAPQPPFPATIIGDRYPLSPQIFAQGFGDIEKQGRKREIVEFLKIIEPAIRDLSIVVSAGNPELYADVGLPRLIPLSLVGGGITHLVHFMLALLKAPDGIVLMDEVENGLHYSVLETMWKMIGEAARKNNTQVFATTHSFECIQAAHQAFSVSGQADFRYYRLGRREDDIVAVKYGPESLQGAMDLNFEVR